MSSRFGHEGDGEYEYASALPVVRTSLKRLRGDVEQAARGHCRWITGIPSEPEISCEGDSCGCIDSSGPDCICTATGFRCTNTCHSDEIRCASQEPPWPVECIEDCPGNGQCRGCYNRITQFTLEQQGEQCFLIRPNDASKVDKWHFLLTKPQEEETVYDFLLGDPESIAIFKRNKSRVSLLRY